MNLGIRATGRLSMQKKPLSSSARITTLLPEPESPVTTIMSRPSAINSKEALSYQLRFCPADRLPLRAPLELSVLLFDDCENLCAAFFLHEPEPKVAIFEQAGDSCQGLQMVRGGVFRRYQHEEEMGQAAVERIEIDPLRASGQKPAHLFHPGRLAVRNRHPLADRGGADLFPLEQGVEQPPGVQGRILPRHPIRHLLDGALFVRGLEAGDDPRSSQKIRDLQSFTFLRRSLALVLCFLTSCSTLSMTRSMAEYRSAVSSRPWMVSWRACSVTSATCRSLESTDSTTWAYSGL